MVRGMRIPLKHALSLARAFQTQAILTKTALLRFPYIGNKLLDTWTAAGIIKHLTYKTGPIDEEEYAISIEAAVALGLDLVSQIKTRPSHFVDAVMAEREKWLMETLSPLLDKGIAFDRIQLSDDPGGCVLTVDGNWYAEFSVTFVEKN